MPRILIIDDDEAIRRLLRERLEDAYEIIDTSDAKSAFLMTLQHRPNAILLDLSMSGLSGFELCQALSSLSFTQKIPIFIVSGQDARNRAFCQNLGASGYFEKPIDFAKLKTALAVALLSKGPERRAEARSQLRVALILKGSDKDGKYFEVRATTENMSEGGFLCRCTASMEEGAAVEVFLCGGGEHHLGSARIVRAERTDALEPIYGFHFITKMNGGA